VAVACAHPALKLIDGCRLVAGWHVVADDLEATVEPRDVETHALNRTPGV
jgi:hypothetical protein